MTSILLQIISFIIIIFIVYIATISHELAHGYTAYKLGDPTAKLAGRLTLNPLKHIDLVGTIIFPLLLALAGFVPLILFKPVPINPNFFKNPNKDSIKVALAGPMINILYAIILALLIRIALNLPSIANSSAFKIFVEFFAIWFILINLMLASFNLIPIPPLDGSWIVISLLPLKAKLFYNQIRTYIIITFVILIATGKINFLFSAILNIFKKITLWIILSN